MENIFSISDILDLPTGNVGGIFGRPFSFFSPAGREGKVVVVVGCPAHLSNVASGQTIMISNSQTFKAQNSGKTGASHRPEKRRLPCFLGNLTRRPPKEAFVSGRAIWQEMGAD